MLWTCPENHISGPSSLELSSLPFHEAFNSIYKKVSFLELCGVLEQEQSLSLEIDKEALFRCYQYRYDQKIEKIRSVLPQLPLEFRQWAQEHSLSAADLYPLCSLENIQDAEKPLLHISSLLLSRAQGVQAMEWIVECLLLKIPQIQETQGHNSGTGWLEHLKQLRFPQTQIRDEEKQKKLLSPWPKALSPRWLRQGDRSGVEIRFVVGSKKELADKISTLNRIYNELHD